MKPIICFHLMIRLHHSFQQGSHCSGCHTSATSTLPVWAELKISLRTPKPHPKDKNCASPPQSHIALRPDQDYAFAVTEAPVGVRIRDTILVFNRLWLERHLEPNCRFLLCSIFLDLRNNLKSSGSSLYECSISYSTLKRKFAPRIPTTTSDGSSERSISCFQRGAVRGFWQAPVISLVRDLQVTIWGIGKKSRPENHIERFD
jgi:hypothetical protein